MLGRACKRVQACKQERVLHIHCIEHQQHIRCIHQRCKLQFGYGRQGGERSIFHWLQRHLCKCNEIIVVGIFEVHIRFENNMYEQIPTKGPRLILGLKRPDPPKKLKNHLPYFRELFFFT